MITDLFCLIIMYSQSSEHRSDWWQTFVLFFWMWFAYDAIVGNLW